MIKKTVFLIVLIISNFGLFSQDQTNDSFFFNLMNQEQINDYFNKFKFLIDIDKNKVQLTDEQLEIFFTKYIGLEMPESLLLESFFRQTTNKTIQKKVLKYIEKNKLNDEFSKILFRKYNSKEKKYKQDKNEQIQYNYNNEYFDENINLFYQSESLVFNKELGLMLFDNPWTNMSYKSDKENKDEDSFFLIYGGGTNSMTINFQKYSNISFEQFKNKEINKKFNTDKYKNWKTVELEKKYIFENSGADKIFIGYAVGPDIIPEIDTATFSIYLYNEKIQKGYSITYFMNFSKMNNNYNIRQRIWNQILFQLCFSFINIS